MGNEKFLTKPLTMLEMNLTEAEHSNRKLPHSRRGIILNGTRMVTPSKKKLYPANVIIDRESKSCFLSIGDNSSMKFSTTGEMDKYIKDLTVCQYGQIKTKESTLFEIEHCRKYYKTTHLIHLLKEIREVYNDVCETVEK